jgi:ABC-type protease/lipase transport system fused ATPase/permease subunit
VLTSRSVETLAVLTVLLVGLYVFLGGLNVIRARVLARLAVPPTGVRGIARGVG